MNFSVSHAEGRPCFIHTANLAWLIHQPFIRQLMRISLLLMAFSLTCLTMLLATPGKGQGAETTQVTLELNDETLVSALKKIELKTPFRFVYRNKEIKSADHLSLPEGTRSVSETLDLLLANKSLTFRQINNNILIERKEDIAVQSELASESGAPIQQSVTGKATSAEDGSPLPGVSVLIKGTQTGTVTDVQGNYSLSTTGSDAILVFSFIGYKSTEVAVEGRSTVDVSLQTDVTQLTEVVVTSFGIEQEKRSVGFSAQAVKGENLIQTRQPNVVSALQGQVSGVQITNAGGAPGTSARIVIRGLTSLNTSGNNQPLFVIDGIPMDNSTDESPNTSRGLSNRAADINPNDIESVNILKGAAATALYGVRAAAGAIVITTKRGKAGAVRIDLNSSFGFQKVNRYPDFQTEYGQGWYGVADRTSVFPAWGAPFQSATSQDPTYKYYDNYRNVMETGKSFDNYLSVSGGNEFATFYTSVSNTKQTGVIPSSSWDRTSAKLSGTLNFKNKFTVTGSFTYSNSGGDRVPGDRFGETLMYYPTSSDATDYINEDGTQKYIGLSDNPIYAAKFWTYEDDVDRTLGNLFFSYKPASWISLNYRVGSDFYSDFREEILPGPKGIEGETPLSTTGYIEHTRITNRILNSNFFAEINKQIIPDLKATVRVGQELFQEDKNKLINTGNNFVIPEYYQFNNVTEVLTEQEIRQRRLIGVYGDLVLNYKDYLYLNVTGRNDWTSTLPKGNNSFFYPSVNVSFVFSDALQLPALVSYGKIRGSFGEVGKDTDPYLTSTTYSKTEGFPLNGQVGFTRSQVKGSETLKPERTTNVEVGAEMKFLDKRVGFEFTWYKANSRDQIFSVPVSNTTGYTRFVANAGEIENRGIELTLTGTPVRTTDFSWDVTLNFTRNRNKVIDLAEGFEGGFTIGTQFGYSGSTVTMALTEGAPYGNLYGTSFQRYYGAEGTPEGLEYLDRDKPLLIGADGFPVRNTSQLVVGNAQPKWLAGLRNNFRYKGFNLAVVLDVRWDIDQYNQYGNFLTAFGKEEYTSNRNDVVVFDGYLADGTKNTKAVWMGQGIGPDGVSYGDGFYRNTLRRLSEPFVQDASFVKLRSASLSYSLPAKILTKSPFQAVTFSASVNNIILWTPWSGYDPESFSGGAGTNVTGFSGLDYPGVATTVFSLNLTL
ncbi:SusC/RagA family TonB-linked outer membrane protein [Ohtaekwangia koreensis]|uniref:TonB-linked outer membrane protein, SusC/RagA family n=1 Tax=Ohtaekwangia koreensis TaxID=688867 RepID=A0A1T5MN32_9BACT|nr:SusC/RagA family TonB-linked outer membrane protein [Ohtaekwangia koreensis]SKC89626.1 TonB-linked outer membrane protein, SusC/RagA family [Ohtaekwangia koreensis]